MSLPINEKELAAVGISMAAGCKPCTDYHVQKALTSGATDDEIRQAIIDAACVRESALKIMKAHGLIHLGDVIGETDCGCEETNRIKELVSVGAAYAVNCTTNLEKHIEAAKKLDITEIELKEVVKLAEFIKGKAASHVEKITAPGNNNAASHEQQKEATSTGCC